MLKLRTLGGLEFEGNGAILRGAALQRRPLALLSLLAATGGISRDKVLTYLWPESDESSARNALKQTVYALRRDLNAPDLIVGTSDLRLDADTVHVDLWELERALKMPAESLSADFFDLYRGPFLDGVYVSGAPEFERWADETRSALASRVSSRCEAGIEAAMKAADFSRAIGIGRRMTSLEPLNDRFALSLVMALAANGDRAGAMQHAELHRATLNRELDVEPEPQFEDFIASLKSARRPLESPKLAHAEVDATATSPTAEAVSTDTPTASHSLPSSAPSPVERQPATPHRRRQAVVASLLLVAVTVLVAFTSSWPSKVRAWVDYRRGRTAMSRWDSEQARIYFRRAVAADTSLAKGYLAMAELASWSSSDAGARDEQRWAAGLAMHLAHTLSSTERLRASALAAAANDRWAEACQNFRQLITLDSTSYSAWFGLAECLSRDPAVLPDSTSPSGWKFRTSYQAAIAAYVRAFDLRPDFHRAFQGHAIAHLSRVLFLQPNRARRGATPSGDAMVAFPNWTADTLGFIPFALGDIQSRRVGARPQSTTEAIANNKETLRRLTSLWVASSPESADAFEAHALVLEMLGELRVARGGTNASRSLETARTLSHVPEQQLRLAVAEVRFRVKRFEFDGARILADSLLRAWDDPSPSVAQWLSPVAALTGQAHLAARLGRIAAPLAPQPAHAGRWPDVPIVLTNAWISLTTYAAMHGPIDSVDASYRQLEELLRIIEPADRAKVRTAMLQEPVRLFDEWFPDSARAVVDTLADVTALMQRYLRQRDVEGFRRKFSALDAARAHFRLADRWPDAVFLESKMLLRAGDTSSAIAMIDPYLAAIPVLSPSALDRVQTASSLPQLFLLRAALARASNDAPNQRRWEAAGAALWPEARRPKL